jgi:pimeloyl-ACP methyl ester carboxylesterase
MADDPHLHPSDLRGYGQLVIDATVGMTNLVEAMHRTIQKTPSPLGAPVKERTRYITGFVYHSIRGVTRLVGGSLDLVLAPVAPMLAQERMSSERDAVVAALNGVWGDHLAASGNPLAITAHLRNNGRPLQLTQPALAAALPQASGRILLLAHGLCMNDQQWRWKGHDHGLAVGGESEWTPIYLVYNSGLHISTNGHYLAGLLEALVAAWPVPVEEIVILAHSMGGLVARSACHLAEGAHHRWLQHLRKIIFLGTPHAGSPLERGGFQVDKLLEMSPYTAPFARLGRARSVGITDLRHGSVADEDWAHRDVFKPGRSHHHFMPLPAGVTCCAVAGSIAQDPSTPGATLLGDGLVPIASALGDESDGLPSLHFPEGQRLIVFGANHLELLGHPAVYAQILRWLAM